MRHSKPILAIVLATVVVLSIPAPVAAHDWQTTVTNGEMELGISTSPETPIAGLETEFSGRIADTGSYENEANRTDWGGIVNKSVAIHINGPDGIHDHISATIPEDGAHFHATYRFPEAGTYRITVVTMIEGEEYAFEFQREVELLPARADGEQMDSLAEDIQTLSTAVADLNEQVAALQEQNEELQAQNEELQAQNEELENQHESADSSGATAAAQDESDAAVPGFGLGVGFAAIAATVAFVLGRRS